MEQFVTITGTALRYAGYVCAPLLLLPLIILIIPAPLKTVSEKLSAVLDRISGFAMGFALTAAFSIILIQLAAVLLRYVFGLSFSWLNDSVIFTFAMMFMLGAAATLRDEGHVRVDILRPRFSEKTKAAIELFGSLAFIVPIGILVLYAGSGIVSRSWVGLEHFNESDGLPIKYLFKTLVPAFAILMIGQALSQALKAALTLRGMGNDTPDQSLSEGAI